MRILLVRKRSITREEKQQLLSPLPSPRALLSSTWSCPDQILSSLIVLRGAVPCSSGAGQCPTALNPAGGIALGGSTNLPSTALSTWLR